MYIYGRVNGNGFKFTLDTGASHSILRSDLSEEDFTVLNGIKLVTAAGEKSVVKGKTLKNVVIGDVELVHEFIVADIIDEIIIGMDVMVKHGFNLDLKNMLLTYGNVEIPLRYDSDEENVMRLVVQKDQKIAANSEGIVWAQAQRNDGIITECIVEGMNGKGHPNFAVGRSLVKTNGETVPVRVFNLANTPIIIKQGRAVANCEPVQAIIDCENEGKPLGCTTSFEKFENCKQWFDDLCDKEKEDANKLFEKYQSIFAIKGQEKGRTSLTKHRVNTGNKMPIRQNPRRVPLAKREEVNNLIQEMELNSVIEPSNSPWCSPVVLVKKKDGSMRFCVDFRILNEITVKDSYPLPRIDDTLDMLYGSQYFSTLDLQSGYWQVEMDEKDKEKLAFSVGNGSWQFKVMPFGLCNAPATFERLMELVLKGLHWKTCLLYLDDIIIMGKDFHDHLQNLEEVFERLRKAGLKLNPKKCEFFKHEVRYLGHKITPEGVKADEDKVKTVSDWPRPKNIKELRSFLGLCTYYRKFVKGFATIASPLYDLTSEKNKFKWGKCQETAFITLKKNAVQYPNFILSNPRENIYFRY